jgi:hypothetical protein
MCFGRTVLDAAESNAVTSHNDKAFMIQKSLQHIFGGKCLRPITLSPSARMSEFPFLLPVVRFPNERLLSRQGFDAFARRLQIKQCIVQSNATADVPGLFVSAVH